MAHSSVKSQTAPPGLHFRVPPEPSHLLRARERIRDYLSQYCTERQLIDDVVLCVEEACTNAIRHGDSPEDIEVALRFTQTKLVATVKDQGRGFDVARFDPDGRPDPLLDHGRGLFIMASLMDSLKLRIDEGLEVRMACRAESRCEPAPLESGLGEPPGVDSSQRDARTRAMLEEIDEAFVALDWEYRYVFANRRACQLLGKTPEALLGRSASALFPAFRGSELERGFRAAMELGRPTAMEWQSPIIGSWIETRIYPTSAGVTAYFHDISERKRKELEREQYQEALRASEEFLDGVLGSITDTFVTLDANWRFTFANEAAGETFGAKSSDLIGEDIWEVAPDAVGNEGYVALHRAMAGRISVEYDVDNLFRQRSFHSVAYPLTGGGLAVLAHDTTERARTEAALRASEERYRTIVEASTEGIAIGAPGGTFEFVNQRLAEMLGYSVDELIGMSGSDLVFEGWEPEQAEARAGLHAGQVQRREIKLRCKDGSVLWSRYSATPIVEAQGKHIANLVMHSDVTAAKAAEQALRESEERSRRELETKMLLSEAAGSLTQSLALSEVLDKLARIILASKAHSRVTVSLWDERKRRLEVLSSQGESPLPAGVVIALEELSEPVGRAIAERISTVVDYDALAPGRRGVGDMVTSHLALDVPLYFGERLVGVLAIDDPGERREFDHREIDLIEGIAGQAAVAIENARLFEVERRAQQQAEEELQTAELLLEAAAATTSWSDLDEMLESLGDLLVRSTDHSRVMLQLWDEERQEVEIAVSRGSGATPKQRFPLDAVSQGGRQVIATKQTLVVDYTQTVIPAPHKEYLDEHAFRLMLVVPIVYRGQLVGLITIDQPGEARPFSPREIELVEAIAAQAGAAIADGQLNAEQRQVAERLEHVLANTTDGFFIYDRDWRYVYVNDRGAEQSQKSREELIGKVFWDVFPDVVGTEIYENLTAAAADGKPRRYEIYYEPYDVWFEHRVFAQDDGTAVFVRDVTEQRRADRTLKESERRLNQAKEAAQLGIQDYDVRSGTVGWDARVRELWGVGPDEPVTYETFLSGLHADDREATLAAVDAAMDPRGAGNHEATYRVISRADGQERWVHATWQVAFEDGHAVRMVGTVADITERKRAEEALQRSESRYRELVQNASSAILRWSRDGTISFINEYAQQLFGWSAEEVVGKPVNILVPEQESDGADLSDLVDDILKHPDRYQSNTNENVCRDGRRLWMTWTNRAILNDQGEVAEILAVGSDVTGLKRAEAALRESESSFRALFETMSEGFAIEEIICDEQGKPYDLRYLSVNPAFEHHTGLRAADILGRTTLELFPDAADDPVFEIYGKVALTGEPAHFGSQFGPLHRWFEVSAYQTEPGRFATVFIDTTERKRAEEERQRLLEESHAKAEELQSQSEEMQAQNEELLAQRDTIVRESELRAALNAIGTLLHSTIEPDEVMRRSLAEAIRALDLGAAAIELNEGDSWPVRYAAGLPEAHLGRPLTDEPVIARLVARTGDALVLDDAVSQEEVGGIAAAYDISSLLAVPLIGDEQILGVLLLVERRAKRHFAPAEVDFARRLGTTVGLALENARLHQAEVEAQAQLQQGLESTHLLVEAAVALTSWTDLECMLESLGDILLRATDHTRILLELWDEAHREVEIAVSRGAAATPKQRFAFDGISDGAKEVITTHKTLVIDYATTGIPGPQRAYVDEHAFLLMLVVPIVYRERLVGLITVDQPGEARPFRPREIELVEAIAAQAGAAIENARLFEAERQAQQQSARDLEATRLLLEAASKLNSWTSIDGLLNGLADVVLRATRHTRAYVALLAEDRSQATFVTTVGKDPLPARTVVTWDQLSSVLQDVLTDGRRKIVDYSKLREAHRGIAGSVDSRMALLVPILFGDRVLGHIAIDDPGERLEFSDREVALIEGIASQAAVAIENARLYDEQRHIATTLQDNLIHQLPQVAGLELGVVTQTAFEPELVGGDFSDVFLLDDRSVVVTIGDVAGKGVRAAGLTETVRSKIRAFAAVDPSPAYIFSKTNELMLRLDPDDPHVTAFCAVLDPHTGHLSYASAGHPAPVHLGAFTCRPLEVTYGPPLGSFERPYAEAHAMLALEDYLVLYTDGVTEARRDAELLGERRLLEIVASLRGRSAQEVADGVRDAALAFAGRLRDDIQIVVLRLD